MRYFLDTTKLEKWYIACGVDPLRVPQIMPLIDPMRPVRVTEVPCSGFFTIVQSSETAIVPTETLIWKE